MRHNKKINHLGRTSSHREAMLSNMASSLIKHKRIFTTVAKAKALRKFVEPIVTKSKEDTTHSRRVVFASLQDKAAVTELFTKISEKVEGRPGGYTRIIKTGNRLGDNASMCFIELVDYNENMLKTKKAASKTRRSRKKATTGNVEATEKVKETTEKAKDAPVEKRKEKKEKAVEKTAVSETKSVDEVEVVAEAPVEEPVVAVESAEVVAESTVETIETAEEVVAEVVEETVEEPSIDDVPEAPAEEKE